MLKKKVVIEKNIKKLKNNKTYNSRIFLQTKQVDL